MRPLPFLGLFVVSATLSLLRGADYPKPVEGDVVLRDFKFRSGESLPELRMHYRALGQPRRDAAGVVRNAVLIMHGTGGSGASLMRPVFAGELFGAGQPLDATKYFIILPDGIGCGKSSKPSDGLRAKFPRFGYLDMVQADYRLLMEGLGVNHLHLVMGTSMGCMHTWILGRGAFGFHGRPHAARQRPYADFRPQPRLAPRGHRRDPGRSGLAGRQLHGSAAEPADRGRDQFFHGRELR